MIINPSYFHGDIAIANLDKPEVVEVVNNYIIQYEPEYLRKLLGYRLATDFLNGLQQDPIDSKWLNLLSGDGEWQGLIQYNAPSSNYSPSLESASILWTVGSANSPAVNSNTFTDTRLYNKAFFIERIGSGTILRAGDDGVTEPDYTLTNNGTTVTLVKDGVKFLAEEKYIIHITGIKGAAIPVITSYGVNISPIACYVYWHYQNYIASQPTPFGERVSKTENSTVTSSPIKQVRAWNRMVDMNRSLLRYLNANNTLYGWNNPYCYNELFEKINVFGI